MKIMPKHKSGRYIYKSVRASSLLKRMALCFKIHLLCYSKLKITLRYNKVLKTKLFDILVFAVFHSNIILKHLPELPFQQGIELMEWALKS